MLCLPLQLSHCRIVLRLHIVWHIIVLYYIVKGKVGNGEKLIIQNGLQRMIDAPGLVHYQHDPCALVSNWIPTRFAIETLEKKHRSCDF